MACRPPRLRSRRGGAAAAARRTCLPRREEGARSARLDGGRRSQGRGAGWPWRGWFGRSGLEDWPEQLDRYREDDRGVLLGADLNQGLQKTELQRSLLGPDDLRPTRERLCSLELAVGG